MGVPRALPVRLSQGGRAAVWRWQLSQGVSHGDRKSCLPPTHQTRGESPVTALSCGSLHPHSCKHSHCKSAVPESSGLE